MENYFRKIVKSLRRNRLIKIQEEVLERDRDFKLLGRFF